MEMRFPRLPQLQQKEKNSKKEKDVDDHCYTVNITFILQALNVQELGGPVKMEKVTKLKLFSQSSINAPNQLVTIELPLKPSPEKVRTNH